VTATNLTLPFFATSRIEGKPKLTPFLKWPGGKSQELPAIAAVAPALTGRLIDPFVGGGSVLLATPPEVPAWANDACPELIALYGGAAAHDRTLVEAVAGLAGAWEALASIQALCEGLADAYLRGSDQAALAVVSRHERELRLIADEAGPGIRIALEGRVGRELLAKFARMRSVEQKVARQLSPSDLLANIEGSIRSSLYMSVRARYNAARAAGTTDVLRTADFFFLREFAYASMFRFNGQGEFNVPYGGVTYNRKSLSAKADTLFGVSMRERLANTEFRCQDFGPFLAEANPTTDDFVFVDPPYDSDFSDYDNRSFTGADHRRLRDVLAGLPARVMVVIKDTPAVRGLYAGDAWYVLEAEKTYMWTIKSRNQRGATHLTILNYLPEGIHASHAAPKR